MAERRRYESPVRQRQTAENRSRILSAAADLIRANPSWDWRQVTFRIVAERAALSERTVYRYFATEQDLHTAVMRRLEQDAGIDYDHLSLEDVPPAVARTLEFFSSGAPSEERTGPQPVEEDRSRRKALLAAVADAAPEWSRTDQARAAAAIDILWDAHLYEGLIRSWGMELADASATASWILALVVEAVRTGRTPGQR